MQERRIYAPGATTGANIEMYDPEQGNTEQLNSLLAKVREKRRHLQEQLRDIEVMLLELSESEAKCLEAMANKAS